MSEKIATSYMQKCILTLEKTKSEAEASGLLSRFNEEVSLLGCFDTQQRYVYVTNFQPAKSQVRWKTIFILNGRGEIRFN